MARLSISIGRRLGIRLVTAIAALAMLTDCARPAGCTAGHDAPMTVATLYFGLGLPDGGEVDPESWRRFVATVVTPAFPDGLTMTEATGQWRDPTTGRIIAERTKVVTIAAPAAADLVFRIDGIRAAYRAAFHQQSVGLTLAPVCGSF